MKIRVKDIIEKVKICIDEIGLNDAEFVGTQDNQEMDTIIRSKIAEAVRFIKGNADWDYIEPDTVITSGTISGKVGDNQVVSVTLPSNYLRLCYARLSSWPLYLSDPIYWNDKEYATLCDQYATGTWERPKLALVMKPGKVLELYSAKGASDKIEVGILTDLSSNDLTTEDNISIPVKLEPALIYYIAGLTLLTYRDSHADNMFNQALLLMGASQGSTTASTE